jgi:hypothetical protein
MLCQLSYRGTLGRSRILAIRLLDDGHAGKAGMASMVGADMSAP